MRKFGNVLTALNGTTIQYPCSQKSSISVATNFRSPCDDWCAPRRMASSYWCASHGAVAVGTLAPRTRKCSSRRPALCLIVRTAAEMLECPLASTTTCSHPNLTISTAVADANLPRAISALVICSAVRSRPRVLATLPSLEALWGSSPSQGGASSSQGAREVPPWPSRQVADPALAAAGTWRWART